MSPSVPPITLIVAVAENGVIGRDGRLPWRIPEDMRRFKRLTMGKPCIMGRKTWESLPKKPLPGRTNIVVTRQNDFAADGARIAHSLDDALGIAGEESPDEIMVLGGAAIYAAAMAQAGRILLTEVQGAFAGDAYFPPFDKANWRETAREGPFAANGVAYSFVILERRR